MKTYQKRILNVIAFTGISVAMFSGCTVVKDEIYLQNVELNGTLSQLPVHITDAEMKKNAFHISPHISVNTQKTFTTPKLGSRYTGQIPDTLSDFQRKGLQWNLPIVRFGIDFDYAVSDHIAFMGE